MKSTSRHIHCANVVFQQNGIEEWNVKAAKTVQEVTDLIGVGFEYVTDIEASNCLENVNKLDDDAHR